MKLWIPATLVLVTLSACAGGGPNSAAAKSYMMSGDGYFKDEDYEKAIDYYSDAVKANPREALAYLRRGNAYIRLARLEDGPGFAQEHEMMALANYNECLRINPTISDAYWNRAMIRAKKAKYKLAAQDLLRFSKIKVNDPHPHLLIGQLYEEKFDDPQLLVRAMDHYEKYLELGGINDTILQKVRAWKDLKASAGIKDEPRKGPEKKPGPDKKDGMKPKMSDDEAAKALFESYKKLMMSGDPKERARVPGVIKELLDKYPHTDLVKEKKRFLEIILRSLSGGDEKKPDDK